MAESAIDVKLKRFVDLTCELVGEDAPQKFLVGECDLNRIWDKKGRTRSELNKFFSGQTFRIALYEFNQIMLLLGLEPVSMWFFQAVLGGGIDDLDSYSDKIKNFRIKSALRFGNFKYAFRYFAGISLPKAESALSLELNPAAVWKQMNRKEAEIVESLSARPRQPLEIQLIEKHNRHFVSEIQKFTKDDSQYQTYIEVRETAQFNTAAYLSSDFIDVYIATSMRTPKQFQDVASVIEKVFNNEKVKPLKLRYFDPTLSDGTGRISKGLIEALMLKRAKATLYLAQETDSLGKDSELATTLAQGKDVIVLVPETDVATRASDFREALASQNNFDGEIKYLHTLSAKYLFDSKSPYRETAKNISLCTSYDEAKASKLIDHCEKIAEMERDFFNSRANLLRDIHPLGLQVNLNSGVANGVVVVRNPKEAAEMLYRSITNSHTYSIDESKIENVIKINETVTGSTVRVVSTDQFLTKAFWSNYLETKDETNEAGQTNSTLSKSA
jgi:hypothetical protein